MIPDFPHNIRIRLDHLKFFLLRPDIAKSLPCWLSQFSVDATVIESRQHQLGQMADIPSLLTSSVFDL